MASGIDDTPRGIEKLDHVSILRRRAEEYRKAHRIEDAMILMSRAAAIERGKKPKNYWRDTGLCLGEVGRYEEAVECFDKDLQLNGDSFETQYSKGVALYVLEIHNEALECLYKAYEMKYSEKLRSDAQVQSLKNLRKFEDVVIHFGTQRIPKSDDYLLWHYLGLVLFQLSRYKEAADYLAKAAGMSSEPLILYDWAKCELMLGNPERCYQLLETARNHDAAVTKMLRVDPAFEGLRNNQRFRILLDHRTSIM
ncbi:MAG TPA: tetratricopeptide repeat protein [Nitrososphaera sp.]|nr:tetratricopeptide repeat protein [Nitrososphaera sp.]